MAMVDNNAKYFITVSFSGRNKYGSYFRGYKVLLLGVYACIRRQRQDDGYQWRRHGEDWGGHVPPVLFKVNFLICPNPVRKMGGGGYVCDISPVI